MTNDPTSSPASILISGQVGEDQRHILSPEALAFVADLARRFGPRIEAALARRRERHARLAHGEKLDFLPATAAVRAADWTVAPLPATSSGVRSRSPARWTAR